MRSDELRTAVTKIVELLDRADIRAAVDQYRTAKGDQITPAAARLGHAGAIVMERIDSLSVQEKTVVERLHLKTLGSSAYWQALTSPNLDPVKRRAELVRLASRVMFASSHLPSIVSLLEGVTPGVALPVGGAGASDPMLDPVNAGEGVLYIRLTDAGEKASDPDRVARAIDGIDMLYSACASIARKPAIDLRMDQIVARQNRDRDFRFTGEKDSIAAVLAVIDSIPGALADIDPEQDIDLDAVVRSLPIFQDLNTLASLGTYSGKDLNDITETMHQGSLLTLESGVILIDEAAIAQSMKLDLQLRVSNAGSFSDTAAGASAPAQVQSAADSDEHYNRYLREREAMTRTQASAQNNQANGHAQTGLNGTHNNSADGSADEQKRKDAVEELLKSLGQSRTS